MYIDHVGINTNDMEATLQFYCGILGMRLVRTTRTPDGRRLKDHGVAVTDIIERAYGKTFYFHDPNGIRLQIELKTNEDADSLEGDPNPVPYVRALLQRA